MRERKLWFRNKKNGTGWYPSSWQGWLAVAAHLLVVAGSVLIILRLGSYEPMAVAFGFLTVLMSSIALMKLARMRGERPDDRSAGQ